MNVFSLNYCLIGDNFCQAFLPSVFTHLVVFFFGTVNFAVLLAYNYFSAGGISCFQCKLILKYATSIKALSNIPAYFPGNVSH